MFEHKIFPQTQHELYWGRENYIRLAIIPPEVFVSGKNVLCGMSGRTDLLEIFAVLGNFNS